jgi:DNA excision repair protein ERCC-2
LEQPQDSGPVVRTGMAIPWPFDRVRPGQVEFLADARRAVSDRKHLLAHAPTGIGKTAVALVAALEEALAQDKVVLFLTSRQSQHRIAVETLKRLERKGARIGAVDVIGKQDMCLQEGRPAFGRAFHEFCDLKVKTKRCSFYTRNNEPVVAAVLQRPLHVQELIQASATCRTCPHKVAMDAAKRAHVIVCDYNYVFSEILEWTLERLGRPLGDLVLVVDEAHNLPERIRSHLTGNLALADLVRASRETRAIDPEASHQLASVAKSFERFLLSLRAERVASKEEFVDVVESGLRRSLGQPVTYADLVEMVSHAAEEASRRGLSTCLPEAETFLRRWRDHNEGILRLVVPGTEGKFALRLMDPAVMSRPIFAAVHASILMSGTLFPGGMYADLLGLANDRCLLRTYASPFPRANRLLLVHPLTTTLFAKRTKAMHDLIACELSYLASAAPGNVAAFFPSYEMLEEAHGRLRQTPPRKPLLVERPGWDKVRRDGAIDALRLARASGGAILLGVQGGSLSEGVDYEDNLLSAVVIVGLPMSPPNLEVECLKDYYAKRFGFSKGYDYAYVMPAVNKVLQAAGRPIRSERDRAAIVLLEGRLLSPQYARCLPPDFAPRANASPVHEVRAFFAPGR